jgi:hypothetical protein
MVNYNPTGQVTTIQPPPNPGQRSTRRLATVLIMTAVAVMFLGPPALPGEVTVIRAGKSLHGWAHDRGKIVIMDSHDRTIMLGKLNRMGRVELTVLATGEKFVGRVNPMGHGLLMSPRTGNSLQIQVGR